MTIKTVLFIVSLGLLAWLLVDSIFQLDIAATKNNGLINSEKLKVDRSQNIDSLKIFAKSNLDAIRQNTRRNSELATKRIWLVLTLTVIQIILWTLPVRKKDSVL